MIVQISICMLVIALFVVGGRFIDSNYSGLTRTVISALFLLGLSLAGAITLVSLGY